jgi:iron complex outermembrane receptor protein
VLPSSGNYVQSLAIDGQSLGFADRREAVADGQLLYRGALAMGRDTLRVDLGVTVVRDAPPSPVIRDGSALTTLSPINANFNPADARIDENKYQVALAYEHPTSIGEWDTLVSLAHSDIVDIRAFLHPDLSGDADTQNQRRLINDDYFDTHLSGRLFDETTFVVGADVLYGLGRQTTLNGNSAYNVPLDGSVVPPPTSALIVNEIGTVQDQRIFAGQYAQADWKRDGFDLVAGFRLNETYEHRYASDFSAPDFAAGSNNRTTVKPSRTVGLSYRTWKAGDDEIVAYADYRNDFKPSAIDFGPDFQPDVLLPETAQSYEAGLKGAALDGTFTWQGEAFLETFQNLVAASDTGLLVNQGRERLKGVELEARWQVTPDLALAGNVAWHDARFTAYQFFDDGLGAYVNVAGNNLPLSPHILASGGILYTPETGFNATVVMNYVGRRYLDEENVAPVGGYAALAATLGYRFGRYSLTLEGTNLTNARPPVSASEFGSESFYLLPARQLWLKLGAKI